MDESISSAKCAPLPLQRFLFQDATTPVSGIVDFSIDQRVQSADAGSLTRGIDRVTRRVM